MYTLTTECLQSALKNAARQIVDSEPLLTRIDTQIGDGDHGIGMKSGFSALERQLTDSVYNTPHELLHASGLCLVRTMGGASGVLFGTLLIGGLDVIKDKTVIDALDLVSFFSKSIAAIQKRGRTGPGDKTMIDALVPALEAMQNQAQAGGGIENILKAAYEASLEGVERTKEMLPRAGRSKNFREKALGTPDPGAISVSIFFKGLSDEINNL